MCVVLQVANGNSVDGDKQQPRVTKRPLFFYWSCPLFQA